MAFKFNELCTIEHIAQRAATAAKTFASFSDAARLDEGLHLLAEVRHAGRTLCDPQVSEESKAHALERLAGLFEKD